VQNCTLEKSFINNWRQSWAPKSVTLSATPERSTRNYFEKIQKVGGNAAESSARRQHPSSAWFFCIPFKQHVSAALRKSHTRQHLKRGDAQLPVTLPVI
jgi:hypothetical protein